MSTERRQFLTGTLLAAGGGMLPRLPLDADLAAPRTVTLLGQVLCLTEELEKQFQVVPDCETRGHLYALRTADRVTHPLLPTDSAAAVWLDSRFRTRELQIIGRLFPPLPFLEVIKFQTWRDGILYDLDYFCDVCMIRTHKPGPCECCQDPVLLRESIPQ